jgi:hypothetical protein
VSCPTSSDEFPLALISTPAPFQVTPVTLPGAITVRGTVAFRSPTNASVLPEIVAFLTRYGPPTSTVSFDPNCQYALKVWSAAGITGAQYEAAVTGSL